MTTLPLVLRMVLLAAVLAGAWFDFRFRRLPNWLTVSTFAAGIVFNAILFEREGLNQALEGAGLALLIYIPLYALRGMGAGDVKMMAAVGAVTGPAIWLAIFLVTSIVGGIAALAAVIAKKRFHQTLFNVQTLLGSLVRMEAPYEMNPALDVRDSQSLRLPHGVVIACGTLFCLIASLVKR